MIATRRHFIAGLAGIIAAPAIVRVASLMPISVPRGDALTIEKLVRAWPCDTRPGAVNYLIPADFIEAYEANVARLLLVPRPYLVARRFGVREGQRGG